jgi:YD repeat-containing protein
MTKVKEFKSLKGYPFMVINLLTAAMLSGVSSAAAGSNRYFYDAEGNNIGSSMPAGQNTYFYDGAGNNIGSAMKAGRNTYYYDGSGNTVGSSMPGGLNQE